MYIHDQVMYERMQFNKIHVFKKIIFFIIINKITLQLSLILSIFLKSSENILYRNK